MSNENSNNPKGLTVGDILRLVTDDKHIVVLKHQIENNRTYINTTIIEESSKEALVDKIGWKQLDKMKVKELSSGKLDIPTIHVTYETEVIW